MWLIVGVLLLVPLAWALAGAQATPRIPQGLPEASGQWVAERLPDQVPDEQAAGVAALPLHLAQQWLGEVAHLSTAALAVALGIGVLAALGPGRRAADHATTIVHEFGHGLTAAVLGGRVTRITTSQDGSGLVWTAFSGTARMRRIAVSLAGYLAPGLLAVATTRAVLAGHAAAWFAYLLVALAVMMILAVRSWWGWLVSAGLAFGAVAALTLGGRDVSAFLLVGFAGALAIQGIADARSQWRMGSSRTDAATLGALTGLPGRLFAGLHVAMAFALAALVPWLAFAQQQQ